MFHPVRVVYGSVPAGQARDWRFTLVNSGRTFIGRLTIKITRPGSAGSPFGATVENLVGYAKTDLMIPQAPFGDLAAANAAAAA